MKHYLESHKFYVEKEDEKLVYKVGEYETYTDSDYLHIHLELVAGWDYVNPDANDVQGWCPAERFVEDVQSEIVSQFFLQESMTEALEANGYTILKSISADLQRVIDSQK